MIRRRSYERELQYIFDNLVLMCRYVESAVEKSVRALVERDFDLAREVCKGDKRIDKLERDLEQSCLRLMVMEHPVAGDFRNVSAVLKIITDLERIGDQAWDIAEITTQFGEKNYYKRLVDIPQMCTIVIQMVKDGVTAYINRDLDLARSIETTDDKVDELFSAVTSELVALIEEKPKHAKEAVMLIMVSKYLERIGDHAVNLGEWVEYAITGVHPKKID